MKVAKQVEKVPEEPKVEVEEKEEKSVEKILVENAEKQPELEAAAETDSEEYDDEYDDETDETEYEETEEERVCREAKEAHEKEIYEGRHENQRAMEEYQIDEEVYDMNAEYHDLIEGMKGKKINSKAEIDELIAKIVKID